MKKSFKDSLRDFNFSITSIFGKNTIECEGDIKALILVAPNPCVVPYKDTRKLCLAFVAYYKKNDKDMSTSEFYVSMMDMVEKEEELKPKITARLKDAIENPDKYSDSENIDLCFIK
jgi:hypothetical protein